MRPPRARHLASLVHVISLNLVAKLRLCQSCLVSASSSLVLLYVFVGYRLVLFMSCHATIGLSFHLFRFSSPVTPINLVPPTFFSEDRTHVLVGIYSCGTHLLFTHLKSYFLPRYFRETHCNGFAKGYYSNKVVINLITDLWFS